MVPSRSYAYNVVSVIASVWLGQQGSSCWLIVSPLRDECGSVTKALNEVTRSKRVRLLAVIQTVNKEVSSFSL